MFVPEMENFWSKPPIPPRFGHFVSIGHILSHLVKFSLFQSYFVHIMCYIYGTFLVGQSTFLVGQSFTKLINLVKFVDTPPPNWLYLEPSL